MKTKLFAVIVSGTAMVALCLVGACFPQTSNAQTGAASAPAPDGSTAPVAPDDSSALPPNISPSSPLAQVIRLTQSGVSEDVIMAYVTNSTGTFNLDPDKIIYLKDIGAPDDLATAMMQHDEVLKAHMTASAYQPPPQPAPMTEVVATEPVPADTTYVAPPPTDVTVNYFYNTLTPYGAWVNVDGYGSCWRPTAVIYNPSWQPYCDHGRWVYTNCGWYWISDYSWGWATFHYGRWFHHARYGWCWAPDTIWGPSWVTWRYSGNYCGWAPLPPGAVYRAGVGFFYNGAAVSVGFGFGLGVSAFTFVPTGNFCDPHPWRYRVAPAQVTQVYNQTTVINNFNVDSRSRVFVNNGIAPERITAVTRTEIHPITIRETTTPVARGEQLGRDGRTLMVNRPHFTDNPPPAMNRGEPAHNAPVAQPVARSPHQPPNNYGNNNAQPQPRYQPAAPAPLMGQPQAPHATTFSAPVEPVRSPSQNYAPITPAQPSAPNYNSTDNRRYPSPRMQQIESQSPRTNPGNSGGHAVAPVEHSAPAQPPPAESRSGYPQPNNAGNQYRATPAPSSPPAQPQRSSGGGASQNFQH